MKSIAQARAKFAWECASKYNSLETDSEEDKKRKKKAKDEYSAIVDKVPTYIKTNGLLNTLAFLYSKKGSGKNGEVLKNIREWLTHSEYGLLSLNPNTDEQLMTHLTTSATAKDLIQCTTEVLALFNWLRRFAKSE
ncbi:type III-B CRISPR module-associated protein Cmr5 [Thermaurantimonas aggregans]|uniref:type III-B CRISPR module-associated protein Cmr5 n=1 Tax=Thermaurantimonas aggregans TaxID=2173829 RepID=UPI0023F092B4|nr:type III-B CRISPR module-associated protein Cmr5 [Thermaurantimonas aggregans]MCX8149523.1 type III-B CRISPR module-associated protein Cmr5 [Thermaurantimonas aggregans]